MGARNKHGQAMPPALLFKSCLACSFPDFLFLLACEEPALVTPTYSF